MPILKKADDITAKIINALVVVSFSVLIVACVLQVFTRFVLNNSLSWTEELARYAFIWSNLAGAAICVRRYSHATVTAITDILPHKAQLVLKIIVQIMVAAICGILIFNGYKLTAAAIGQTSPALHVNMALINCAIPVSAICILIHTINHLVNHICELMGKGEAAQ